MKVLDTTVDRLDILVPEDYNQAVTINFTNPINLYEDEGTVILAFGMPEDHLEALSKSYKEAMEVSKKNNEKVE